MNNSRHRLSSADIRWRIHSPYYINHGGTKIICRKCEEEFDINNIDEDFFFDHFAKDFAKDPEVQEFFQMLKDQEWQKRNMAIECKPMSMYRCQYPCKNVQVLNKK